MFFFFYSSVGTHNAFLLHIGFFFEVSVKEGNLEVSSPGHSEGLPVRDYFMDFGKGMHSVLAFFDPCAYIFFVMLIILVIFLCILIF